MNRILRNLMFVLALAAGAAVATPIPNGSFADKAVGWFDGRERTCPEICERHSARAEYEKNTAPPVRAGFVCKIRKAEEGRYWWLFGTQFDTRAACYVTDRDLKGEYSQIYYCLCVKDVAPERPRHKTRTLTPSLDDG